MGCWWGVLFAVPLICIHFTVSKALILVVPGTVVVVHDSGGRVPIWICGSKLEFDAGVN